MSKTLTWWAPFCAGGLGDRLIGLLTTYCISQEINRKFLVKWDHNKLDPMLSVHTDYDFYTQKITL